MVLILNRPPRLPSPAGKDGFFYGIFFGTDRGIRAAAGAPAAEQVEPGTPRDGDAAEDQDGSEPVMEE